MERKRPTLEQFRKAYPEEYAQLSEKSGCREEAFRYYSNSKDPKEIIHAAELAIGLVRYTEARKLLKKATKLSGESLARCEGDVSNAQMNPEGSGMMGAAMGYWNAKDENERIKQRVSALEAQLRTK